MLRTSAKANLCMFDKSHARKISVKHCLKYAFHFELKIDMATQNWSIITLSIINKYPKHPTNKTFYQNLVQCTILILQFQYPLL